MPKKRRAGGGDGGGGAGVRGNWAKIARIEKEDMTNPRFEAYYKVSGCGEVTTGVLACSRHRCVAWCAGPEDNARL